MQDGLRRTEQGLTRTGRTDLHVYLEEELQAETANTKYVGPGPGLARRPV